MTLLNPGSGDWGLSHRLPLEPADKSERGPQDRSCEFHVPAQCRDLRVWLSWSVLKRPAQALTEVNPGGEAPEPTARPLQTQSNRGGA